MGNRDLTQKQVNSLKRHWKTLMKNSKNHMFVPIIEVTPSQDLIYIDKPQSKAEEKKGIQFSFCIDASVFPEEAKLWKALGFNGVRDAFKKMNDDKRST